MELLDFESNVRVQNDDHRRMFIRFPANFKHLKKCTNVRMLSIQILLTVNVIRLLYRKKNKIIIIKCCGIHPKKNYNTIFI